jgi:glycerol transport system ATP-binding protein
MSLTLENLSRVVDGVDYIRDANITFEAGSFNVLLGRTLAGKTSMMRLMAGLDKPDEGRLIYNGNDVTGQSVQKRNVSMIYQQFINYPSMTVYENIASPLRQAKMKEGEIDRRVKETANMLQIDPLLKRHLPIEIPCLLIVTGRWA